MATLPLKSSHKEQPVIRLLRAYAIESEMHPIYSDECFMRTAIHVWCKKCVHGRESVVDEVEPGRRVVSTTDARGVSRNMD